MAVVGAYFQTPFDEEVVYDNEFRKRSRVNVLFSSGRWSPVAEFNVLKKTHVFQPPITIQGPRTFESGIFRVRVRLVHENLSAKQDGKDEHASRNAAE